MIVHTDIGIYQFILSRGGRGYEIMKTRDNCMYANMKKRSTSISKDEHNIGVSIFLFDSTQTNILLGKRKNSFRAGTLKLPGGHVRVTESIVDTMKRELQEETGVVPIRYKYLGVIREYQKENNGSFIHFIFKCTKYSGVVTNMEPKKCGGWLWYDLKNLPNNILKGHKLALDLLTQKTHLVDFVD
jgi:ADP-ribose pyrophosphatase YjhB (NUDIX family)